MTVHPEFEANLRGWIYDEGCMSHEYCLLEPSGDKHQSASDVTTPAGAWEWLELLDDDVRYRVEFSRPHIKKTSPIADSLDFYGRCVAVRVMDLSDATWVTGYGKTYIAAVAAAVDAVEEKWSLLPANEAVIPRD